MDKFIVVFRDRCYSMPLKYENAYKAQKILSAKYSLDFKVVPSDSNPHWLCSSGLGSWEWC